MQIHQLVHTLNYGDAISGEALAIKRMLRQSSFESEIFCLHAHEKLKDEAVDWKRYQQFAAHGETQALLLHYSIASPLNTLFSQANVVRGIIYHNLTPVHWFTRYNSRVADDLRRGREELPGLLQQSDLVIADSEFNKGELEELGCSSAQVLPLVLDSEKWNIAPNPGIENILRSHGGRNMLHVGRLAPNKRLEDIIKAFYFYHHKIDRKSRLWLVGADVDTEIYSFELRRLVSELRLKEAVFFVGAVSDCELAAFYRNADLYLCLSEHEGFCVPLLEAMYFGVPVLAYDSSAVGETLGEGGVLCQRKAPAEFAELMNVVCTDSELRAELIKRGKLRAASFNEESFRKLLEEKIVKPAFELGTAGTRQLAG